MEYGFLMSIYKKDNPIFLRESIESMVNQTSRPKEIILVRDGILDESLEEVLKGYEELYPSIIKIVGYDTNKGLGHALNFGLQYCTADLIARMDADDISKINRCELQYEKMKANPELDIVGAAIDEFETNITNVISRRVVPSSQLEIYEFAKRRSAFNHPTVMFKKESVLKCGGYNSELRRNQDVDLFGRMLYEGYQAYNFSESLLYFRSDSNLLKRRKSLENTRSYISTIKRFWKMGYSSQLDYLIVLSAQTVLYLSPSKLQNIIYKKFLRK